MRPDATQNEGGCAVGAEEYTLFPFLLVVDTSGSMAANEGEASPIDAVNEALPELLSLVKQDPQIEEVARVGLIEFNDHAHLRLPISDLATVAAMPELEAGGLTSYESAFTLIRQTLEDQVARMGRRMYRPVVFFLSDGHPEPPDQDWQGALQRLVDPSFKYRPSIVAFGFGDADKQVIQTVGTKFAFMARDVNAVSAVREVFSKLFATVIMTSQSATVAHPGLTFPQDMDEYFEALPVIDPEP